MVNARIRKPLTEEQKLKRNQYMRNYYKKNPIKKQNKKILNKKYREENKEKISKLMKKYREENKEKIKKLKKEYYLINKEKIKKYKRKWEQKQRKENIQFVLRNNIRNRMYYAIKKGHKSKRTLELLGCSLDFFIEYISLKFDKKMNWENYGEWHIDHIKPCASFDLLDPKQQEKCFHYTNLQPLWAFDNLSKGASLWPN